MEHHDNLCLSCQSLHTIWYVKLPTAVKASMASSDLENTSWADILHRWADWLCVTFCKLPPLLPFMIHAIIYFGTFLCHTSQNDPLLRHFICSAPFLTSILLPLFLHTKAVLVPLSDGFLILGILRSFKRKPRYCRSSNDFLTSTEYFT